jgi:hypothetical protein
MTDSTDTKPMTVVVPTALTDFIGSVWGKTLAILTAISIVMGILLEAEALITGYYTMKKTAAEAELARLQANANGRPATDYEPYNGKTP